MFFSKYITKKTLWISVSILCATVVIVPTTVVLTHKKKIESNPSTTTEKPNSPTTKVFSTSTDASSSRVTTTTTTTTESPGNGCEINPSAIKTSPVLLYSGTSDIIYPEPGSNTTKFTTNQLVDFACLGNKLNLNGQTVVTAACMNKETFRINGQTVEWKDLTCSGTVVPNITQVTDLSEDDTMQSCYNNKDQNNSNRIIATIGFNLPDGRNIVIIKICFDFDNKITLFSNYNLTSAIGSSFKDVQTYRFSQDTPIYKYSVSLRKWYRDNQTTINRILGFSNHSTNYVNNNIYINTGHIAANTDFMYSALQVATYRFINAAPQWNTIDFGNWNQIEMSVRNYSISAKKNLQIWTGIYGICSLTNFISQPQNVFIYYDPRDQSYSPAIPIPDVFWKLVYNPDNQQGIVFVTHNNPYDNQTNLICDNDISDQISWLNVNLKDYTKGYSYSCEYSDSKFQKIVDYIPKIEVKGLLL